MKVTDKEDIIGKFVINTIKEEFCKLQSEEYKKHFKANEISIADYREFLFEKAISLFIYECLTNNLILDAERFKNLMFQHRTGYQLLRELNQSLIHKEIDGYFLLSLIKCLEDSFLNQVLSLFYTKKEINQFKKQIIAYAKRNKKEKIKEK